VRIVSKIATEKGLTLDDLAARATVPPYRLHRCERGTAEPWITDIFLVAKALEVSPLWLFNKVLVDGNAVRSARMRSHA
jgi:transcriptional regulator with XRE-family HTH domain